MKNKYLGAESINDIDGEEPWTTNRYRGGDGYDDDSDLEIQDELTILEIQEFLKMDKEKAANISKPKTLKKTGNY